MNKHIEILICKRTADSLFCTKAFAKITYVSFVKGTWFNPESFDADYELLNHRGDPAPYLSKHLTSDQKYDVYGKIYDRVTRFAAENGRNCLEGTC